MQEITQSYGTEHTNIAVGEAASRVVVAFWEDVQSRAERAE